MFNNGKIIVNNCGDYQGLCYSLCYSNFKLFIYKILIFDLPKEHSK